MKKNDLLIKYHKTAEITIAPEKSGAILRSGLYIADLPHILQSFQWVKSTQTADKPTRI